MQNTMKVNITAEYTWAEFDELYAELSISVNSAVSIYSESTLLSEMGVTLSDTFGVS
jgi:hypothetical protein